MSWKTLSKRTGIVLLALAGCTGSPSMMTAPAMDLGGAPDLTRFSDLAVRGDLAVAANDLASPGDLEPSALSLDPPSYDFGSLAVGGAATYATFTLTNSANVDSGPLTVGLIGTGASDFNTVSDSCNGNSLAASSTCSIEVQFYPSASGLRRVTLNVTGSPGESAESSLKGTGLSAAQLGIMPTPTFDFGPVASAAPSAEASLTVTNNGGSDSGSIDVTLTGADVGEFVITSNACEGNTLAASATCTIKVTFNPSSLSAGSATLQVSAFPGGTTHVDLTGTGATASQLALTSSPTVSFDPQLDNTTSSAASVVVTNSGGAPTGAPVSAVLSGDDAAFFAITQSCGVSPIAGSASCTVTVTFTPNAPRSFNATLTLSASPGGQVQVPLSGSGLGPASLVIGGDALTFDSVPIGSTSAIHNITVKNQGDVATSSTVAASLTDSSQFLLASNCSGPLAAGASCTASVRFHPSAPTGAKTTDLQFTSTGLTTQTAHLSGTAVNGSTLTISPVSPFDYTETALVADGVNYLEQPFTVTNGGGATSGTIATLLGPDPNYSIKSDLCVGTTVDPGNTCTLTVRFVPQKYTSGGTESSFTLTENGNSVIEVLQGAAQSPPHLQWSTDLNFNGVHVGATSAFQQTVLRNIGDQTATGLSITTLGTDASQFQTTSNNCGSTLPKDGFCTVKRTFAPTTGGSKSATMSATATNALDPGNASLIGDAQWQITASLIGNGSGYVSGSFGTANLSCGNGGACTLLVDDGKTVQLTAHPDTSSTFTSFSGGGCGIPAACTTSAIHADTPVGAEFDLKTYNFAVGKQHAMGASSGWGWVDGTQIQCDESCPNAQTVYTYGTSVTLTAKPDAGFAFQQWSWPGSNCDGTSDLTCRFVVNDATLPNPSTQIEAVFTPINKAFVSSWNPYGYAVGGISAANTECQTLATNAGLGGTHWKAWLSDSTHDAKDNFSISSRGWVRIDGQPVLDTLTGALLSPIDTEETWTVGTLPVSVPVYTGTLGNGTKATDNCGDWKVSGASGEMGYSSRTGFDWGSNKTTPCGNQAHVYCLEDDYNAPMSLPGLVSQKDPSTVKHAFLSTMPYSFQSSGTTFLDFDCSQEAGVAGLSNAGSFIALVAPDSATAASRLSAFSGTWYRVDGVPLFTRAMLAAGTIPYSTINEDAHGIYSLSTVSTWTGATNTNVSGTATCGNWKSTSGSTSAGHGLDVAHFFDYGTQDACSATDHHLYCVEN